MLLLLPKSFTINTLRKSTLEYAIEVLAQYIGRGVNYTTYGSRCLRHTRCSVMLDGTADALYNVVRQATRGQT